MDNGEQELPDFNQALTIDPDALDEMWLEQPKLYFTFSKAAADVRDLMERAERNVDIVTADVGSRVRKNPSRYGIEERATEGAIKTAVEQDEKVQKAHSRLLSLKHKYNVLRAAVGAFEQRKSALENLVRLHGQQYFGDPAVRGLDEREADMVRTHIRKAGSTKSASKINGVLNGKASK